VTDAGPPYVALEAYVSAGEGIFVSPAPGTLTTVVVQGSAVPAPVGGTFGPPEMQDMENGPVILFKAPISGGCASQALYTATGGIYSLIVKAGGACADPAPGGGNFTSIIEAQSSSGGTTVFLATTSLGVTAIYKYVSGTVTRLVGPGDVWDLGVENVPQSMLTFSAVAQPRLNNSGQVSFRGTLPLPYGEGYFLATGDPPEITKEALPIDPAPTGGSYTGLSSGGPHDLGGEVRMLLAGQQDGRTAVTQFDPYDVTVMEGESAPGSGGASYGAPLAVAVASSGGTAAVGSGTTGAPCGGAPHCFGVWKINACLDLDRDGICDGWETGPVDLNKDGDTDIDLSLAGNPGGKADATRKDIYVEIDWMDCSVGGGEFIPCNAFPTFSHDPDDNAITDVVNAFANAPVYNPNSCEDGVCTVPPALPACSDGIDNGGSDGIDQADSDCTGITLHISQDEGIPYAKEINWTYEDFPATCGDGIENGSVDGADANDPDCHTDGNAGNPASFDDSRAEDGKRGSCNDGVDNSDKANGFPDGNGDGLADSADPDCHPLSGGDGWEDGNASCNDHIDNGGDVGGGGEVYVDKGDSDGTVEKRVDGTYEDGECEVPDDFDDDKAAYFGTAADRAEPDKDNLAAKKAFYHYAIFANDLYAGGYSSGKAEILGNDLMITPSGFTNGVGTEAEQAAMFMHELGHNLGLRHGGDENTNYKPNYLSIMNYLLEFSGGSWYVNSRPLDYSRWDLADLNEQALDETKGIDNNAPPATPYNNWQTAYTTYFSTSDTCDWKKSINATGDIDWNNDGDKTDVSVAMGINGNYDATSGSGNEACQQAALQTTLHSYDDWSNLMLQHQAGGGWGDGAPHYPWTQYEPVTVADADGDGRNDLNDNCPAVPNPYQENRVHPATQAGDHCDDPDADSVFDIADNCPDVANADQVNTDGDEYGDACEQPQCVTVINHWKVPTGDTDCDGWTDASETFSGTLTNQKCMATPDPNDEAGTDAWPVDYNDDQLSNGQDILKYNPKFGSVAPGGPGANQYSVRFDLNGDGIINGQDILKHNPFFGKFCSP
jgi:hypothetical protein